MQATIDGMSAELRRSKSQLDETQTVGEGLSLLGKQVTAQGEMMRDVTARLSEVTVPNQVYQQAMGRIGELEQALSRKDQEIQAIRDSTVSKEQYARVESKIGELESILSNSMPKAEFEDLTQQINSLAKTAPNVSGNVELELVPTSTSFASAPQQIHVTSTN